MALINKTGKAVLEGAKNMKILWKIAEEIERKFPTLQKTEKESGEAVIIELKLKEKRNKNGQ